MGDTPIKTSREGPVLRLTLDYKRKLNWMDEAMVSALEYEAARASRDDKVRAVILDAAGDVFCAGIDPTWLQQLEDKPGGENRKSAARMASMYHTLNHIAKPLVGRIQGGCLGAGVGLAAVCDIVVTERDCNFAVGEVRLGLIPGVIAPYLIHKIGPSHCRDLLLTGRSFSAEEARKMSLAHHVVSMSGLDVKVDEVIECLLKGAPGALKHTKEFLFELDRRHKEGQALGPWTAAESARAMHTSEGRSGVAAFLEKATPPWNLQLTTPTEDKKKVPEDEATEVL